MKKTSKLFLLLASLGMLVACGNKGNPTPPPPSDPNQINVIYFKSYVSQTRATEMKNAYVASLQAASVEVDASKVNFFESTNSKVSGFVDEILAYNRRNPTNKVDVILGANGFSNAEPESLVEFEQMYVSDETDYTYGTHSTATNNTNRKFWYNKDKATDPYVAGLQTYLKANWTGEHTPEPVQTNKLVVMVYSNFVSETRFNEMQAGFNTYLTNNSKTITTLQFVHETETSTIADFMDKVTDYDTAHPDAKVDALLGLKTNSAITAAGFISDGIDYNYGDKADSEQANKERRYWYKQVEDSITIEEKLLQDYLKANWVEPEETPADYYLVGSMNTWSETSTEYPLTKVDDNHYKYEGLALEANDSFKVYYPAGATADEKWFTNASTWNDCGFTLSDPDKNIVVTDVGNYTIDFFVVGENNNHVTLTKQVGPTFTVGIYDKYVTTNANTLKTGLQDAFTAANIQKTLTFTSLGTGNVSDTADLITTEKVLLGFNGDTSSTDGKLAGLGFEKYSEDNYLYGTDANRKLWVLTSEKESVEVTAIYNYLQDNWLPVMRDLYLVGTMNDWSESNTDYKLTKVTENQYSYANLQVTDSASFKVYYPAGATTDDKWFTNASTWEDCGFTLSDPDKNIVLTGTGKYNINFYWTADNNNHITVEKVNEASYTIAVYKRYVSDAQRDTLLAGIQAAFTAADITKTVTFELLGGNSTNVATAMGAVPVGTQVLLGFNANTGSAITNAGYELYDDTEYNYGSGTRKLWVLSSAKTAAEVVVIYNYLQANFVPAA